jgi:polysaccharide chain length determinant protein (PEP-CTERM system associated)
MDDFIRQFRTALRGTWQKRWLGLAVAWIVGLIAAVVVLRVPDKFEASARIYVDTQSVLKPLMSGLTVQPNVDQQIMILSRTLISRPNVEKLVRMADLDLQANSKSDHDALVDDLMKTLEIKSAGRDNLYTLAYRDAAPEQAKRVVQSLVSIFVESSLGDKQKDSDSAKKFIDEQIRIYEKKLEEAEGRLKDFKLRNLALGSADGKDSFGRLGEVNAALNQARLDLHEAENSRDALRRQIQGEDVMTLPDAPNADNGMSVPEIDTRIETMKRNLDTLLQRFTEEHPDVVGTRRVIKELEEQRRQEVAARKKAGGQSATSLNSNPIYQQLKVSLAEAEANVASLRVRVAEYERRYAQLRQTMERMPQIEEEYAQLNRDYDINKKNYESLVSRREAATMSGEMEAASGVADFRLIDPPRVSPRPVAPNRLLLLPLALLLALVVGAASSFAAAQVRPTFFDGRSLREATSLPLLGTVSLRPDAGAAKRERRSLVRFLAGLGSLVGAYAAGVVAVFIMVAGVA